MEGFSGTPGPGAREILAETGALQPRPCATRHSLAIRGASHFLFGDDGRAIWSCVLLRALRLARVLKIDGRRQVAVTRYAVRRFFDAYVKQKSAAHLNLLSPQYLELELLVIH